MPISPQSLWKDEQYISLKEVAQELQMSYSLLYYYVKKEAFTPRRFPYDEHKYLTLEEFNHIRGLRRAKAARHRQ